MNNSIIYRCELPSGAIVAVEELPSRSSVERAEYRCVERKAWHALAREVLGCNAAEFEYNAIGAPYIVDSKLHISVSHSTTLVAIIISDKPCAIDIESLDRNFSRVASRYIAACEQQDFELLANYEASLWSIKETLYKYAQRKELDLLRDIRVTTLTENSFTGSILSGGEIAGAIETIKNHTLTYIY